MSLLRYVLSQPLRLVKYNFTSSVFRRLYSQKINISDEAVQKFLRQLMIEHECLLTAPKRTILEIQRLREIKPIVQVLEQRIALFDSIETLKELKKTDGEDPEIKKLIAEEASIYLSRLKDIDNELQSILLDPYLSDGGILLEIVAGAGGQEAMLFARELFDLYISYAEYKGWETNVASLETSDLGGIRKASMLIQGYGVPELMLMEAGVHRVQRIPATEKGGRIHTSTVSVAVLPQPTEVELEIFDCDVTVETKRASGAGGQHVNTTDSAVRLIHNPTGTVVECQEGRSQIKNKEIAMQKLRALILQKKIEEQTSKIQSERKSQMGTGNRNEKIRTYNYPQDRVTEHRDGGTTVSLKAFMKSGEHLDQLQENLLKEKRYQDLMYEISEFLKAKEDKGAASKGERS